MIPDIRRKTRLTADLDPEDFRRLEEAALSYGLPLEEIALGALAAGVDLHRAREARILRPREWGPGVPPMGRPW